MQINEAVALGLSIEGSMLDAAQLEWLYALAQSAPVGPACEVGVYTGGSLVCWAQARAGVIYAVDPFGPEGGKWARAYQPFIDTLAANGLTERVVVVRETSFVGAHYVPDDLAFLFIDADHSLAGIPRDMLIWPQKVMPGGIIVFHDYVSSKPTAMVGCSVDAWQAAARWHDLGLVGSAKAFQRPVPSYME